MKNFETNKEQNMHFDTLKIENQLCFPIYACAREVIKKYKPFLDEIGITYTQYIVMLVLWSEKSINVKCLGEVLYLDSGTLTPVLKKLQAQGLICRERLKEDERNLLITLTKKGEELKESAKAIPEKIGSCVNISKEEAISLHTILYKILSNR